MTSSQRLASTKNDIGICRQYQRDRARAFALVALFALLTLVLTYPLSRTPGSVALDLGPDTRLFLWTLGWDVHALTTSPLDLFDANIFYPEKNTLAYSEHQIGSALLALPFYLVSGNLVLAMNAVLLLSCLASALGTYYLARVLGIGRMGALVAALIFAFAPPRFFRLGQLHLASVQWIPLTLAFVHRYAAGGSRRHLVWAAVFFTLQALAGGQSAVFLALAVAGLVGYLVVAGKLQLGGKLASDVAFASVLVAVVNAPFAFPYLEVRSTLGLERSLHEAEEWSPHPESFVAAPTHVQSTILEWLGAGQRVRRRANAYLFPGWIPLVLALVSFRRQDGLTEPVPPKPQRIDGEGGRPTVVILDSLLAASGLAAVAIEAMGGFHIRIAGITLSAADGLRAAIAFAILLTVRLVFARRAPFSFRSALERARRAWCTFAEHRFGLAPGFYLLAALFSLWAALGPRFGLYAAMYRLLPGFDFIRVPSRLTIISLLGLAVLAGVGFERLLAFRHLSSRSGNVRKALAAVGVLLLVAELAAFPLDANNYEIRIPLVDRWLAEQDPIPVVVALPVVDPRDDVEAARRHSAYMLYSTAHFSRLVNGYSGFTPARHDRLFRDLVRFPDEQSLTELEELGVQFAVLYRAGYSNDAWEAVQEKLGVYSERLRLAVATEDGQVWELTRRVDRAASPAS